MTDPKEIHAVVVPDTSSSDDGHASKDIGGIAVTEVNTSVEVKNTSRWRKIVGYFWDSVEGDPEYRQYVQRLDLFFLLVLQMGKKQSNILMRSQKAQQYAWVTSSSTWIRQTTVSSMIIFTRRLFVLITWGRQATHSLVVCNKTSICTAISATG